MAGIGKSIDGGWFRVNIASVEEKNGEVVVSLDLDSLWVNRRTWGYWRAFVCVAWNWLRGKR